MNVRRKKELEITRLEKENRELKSLVRSLKKRLKKVDRYWQEELEKAEIDESDISKDSILIPEQPKKCPECDSKVDKVKVAGRCFDKCSECIWRSKAKKC